MLRFNHEMEMDCADLIVRSHAISQMAANSTDRMPVITPLCR